MIHIFLRSSEKCCSQISLFERFLESYRLSVVKRTESKKTIELVVNGVTTDEIKSVNNLVFDFFKEDIISLRTIRPFVLPLRSAATSAFKEERITFDK